MRLVICLDISLDWLGRERTSKASQLIAIPANQKIKNRWVFMGGDVCHARHFFSSCCGHGWDIGTTYGPVPTTSMHGQPDLARNSIGMVALSHQLDNVFVAIAHDPASEGIMPEFPKLVNRWRERGDKEAVEKKGQTLQPRK